MDLSEIKSNLNKIADYSVLVKKVNDHSDELFNYLNQLPQSTKQELFNGYGNHNDTGPIIDIRTAVAKQLLSGDINKEYVTKAFNDGKNNSPKQFAPFGNLFSLLYPFVILSFNEESKTVLQSLALKVQKDMKLENYTKIVVYGFEGPRKNGSTSIWLAIYNNTHPKQQKAKQLFFAINNGNINYALFDWNNAEKIEEVNIQPGQFAYSTLLDFYNKYRNVILEDNYTTTSSEIDKSENDDKELITSLNTILYGPPGTGKTYNTKKIAVKIISKKV